MNPILRSGFRLFVRIFFSSRSAGLFSIFAAGVSLLGQEVRSIPTAEDELKTFVLAPGLRLELVADGTVIRQPIGMQFSPDGRLWVLEAEAGAESAGGHRGGGSVVVLEDTNGDGRMDRRTVFVSGLSVPRGMVLLGNGVLVSDAADFFFFRDRDGDLVSDERIRVATDFSVVPGRRPGPNGLFLALDNWIYLAGSPMRLRYYGSGGFVRDFTDRRGGRRITQDEIGRLYYSEDPGSLHMDRVVSGYRWRNLGYRGEYSSWVLPVEKPEGWSAAGAAPSPTADALIYRGMLFGDELNGHAIIAESSPGRIMRYPLPVGDAVPANRRKAYAVLQSNDTGFRPISMAQGLDGALYLAAVNGAGAAPGRIWRLAALESVRDAPALPSGRSPPELIGELGHPDGWRRDTAQRLILEREDATTAPLVRAFALGKASALGRVHALWTLEGLDAVDRETVLRLLDDNDPRVCATAIRMAEKFLYPPADAEIMAKMIRLTEHADAAVRLQLVLSLGEAALPEADEVLWEALARGLEQPLVVDAVLSGISGRETGFVVALAGKLPEGALAAAKAVAAATSGMLITHDLRRMTLHAADHARLNGLFALLVERSTPEWVRAAIVDGIERYIPKGPRGGRLRVNLAVEPEPLIKFATGESPGAQRMRTLLDSLNWPGKAATPESVMTLTEDEKVIFEKGRTAYPITCAGCHQPQGQGLAGLAPPLAGSRSVQGDGRIVARIVLCGKVQEMYPMPTLRGAFDDESIAAVLTYVRNSWGNAAPGVSPADVASARAATAGRSPMAFTDFELLELAGELARP